MSLCSYILLATIIAFFFIYKWLNRERIQKLTHFYNAPSLPLIGSLKYLSADMQERTTIMINSVKTFRMPAVLWVFHVPVVLIGTGGDIHTVLNESNGKGLYDKLTNFFGDGILVKSGAKWRKSRRTIDPMFSTLMMQQYLKIFNRHSEKLTKKMKSFADTDVAFDIWNYVGYTNADIIFDNMADYRSNILDNEDEHIIQLMERGAQLDSQRCTQPLLFLDFMNNAYLYVTGQWKVFAEIDEFFTKIIRAKMEVEKFDQSHQLDVIQETQKKNRTVLNALIQAHYADPEYTFECLKGDFQDAILAGSATAARTVSFALLMLAIHPDVQEKVYQEIKTIFGNTTRSVEMDDVNQLVYLEQCVKETLRKYPVVPLSFRKHSKDIVLNEKQTIPANTDIVIGTYVLHHDEQVYPNPESWNPDRFAPDVAEKRDKLAFLPFGTGPQSCIGAKYATITLKTQLVHLLRSYRFETDMTMDDVKLFMDVALKSANGYYLKLWSRECNNSLDFSAAMA